MPEIRIVLVGSKFEGNVGAIARAMSNFGFEELYLVNPCELGDDAYRRAKHGYHILDNARIFDNLEDALEGCFLTVGTSGAITKGDTNFARIPLCPGKLAEDIKDYDEKIAIIFGREDIGLYQDEVDKCDLLVNIPTKDSNPIMNLSHAASIIMYELSGTVHLTHPEPADSHEKELLFSSFDDLLDAVRYSKDRKHHTSIMFRKMMGRSIPTRCEYHTIMGVIGKAVKMLNDSEESDD